MRAGLIADLVVVIFMLVTIVFCTKRGFIRSVLRYTSSIIALVAAFFSAAPLANLCEQKFGWCATIDTWHIPFISAGTLLTWLMGIGVFILVRLVLLLLDRLLQSVKEKVGVINLLDRIMGFVFGVCAAVVEVALVFMLVDALGLQATLQLTPDAGGIFAHHLFTFFKAHIFPIVNAGYQAASDHLPKV